MKTSSLVVAGGILMFGYANLSLAADIVDAENPAQVAHCTFVKDVNGRSVFGARLQAEGLAKAKQDSRDQAAEAGATTVLFGAVSQVDVTTITAKAYRCPK